MRCPTLADLPPPPSGRVGWPWTIETPQLPEVQADGRAWPRISVVTPSYNQGAFIEETIRSVLLQGYPDLEYFVLDGGSSDGSVDIIKRYAPWISQWRSGRDGGQSAAIADGLSRATGRLVAWINSDDGYLPSAFSAVAKAASTAAGTFFIYGNDVLMGATSIAHRTAQAVTAETSLHWNTVQQHATFWDASLAATPRADLQCAMDFELWLRILPAVDRIIYVPKALAFLRKHAEQKTDPGNAAWRTAWDRDLALIRTCHPSMMQASARQSDYVRFRLGNALNKVRSSLAGSATEAVAAFPSYRVFPLSRWGDMQ